MSGRYRGRVRTGCLECRVSKVRCDEQHPFCKRCVRLKRVCEYDPKETPIPSPPLGRANRAVTHHVRIAPAPSHEDVSVNRIHQVRSQSAPSHTTDVLHSGDRPSRDSLSTTQQPAGQSTRETSSTSIESPSLLSHQVSQDIYLCTTIDLLAATEQSAQPSLIYFLQAVESPSISIYDQANWAHFKTHTCHVASENAPITAALLAVQSLYQAQAYDLPLSHSMVLFQSATRIFETMVLDDDTQRLDDVILNLFLLCLFEMIEPNENWSNPLGHSHGSFVHRLETWSINSSEQAPISLRIAAWLLICHSAARRGGNTGLVSSKVQDLLQKACCRSPNLPPLNDGAMAGLSSSLLSSLVEPLFTFYFSLQQLSTSVADLSHYHRSRFASEDQEEVLALMLDLRSQLQSLWDARPGPMRHSPAELRSQLSREIVEPLILLVGICTTVYNTEIVEWGRTLSDPPLASPEAKASLAQIREIIESEEWNTSITNDERKLHAAFVRPLFLYAIESIHESETQWAIKQLRKINDRIYRSGFFASFAEGLTGAQRAKGRRVTTKWFCWQAFGVTPPYL